MPVVDPSSYDSGAEVPTSSRLWEQEQPGKEVTRRREAVMPKYGHSAVK
jgi:hypothetical protein